MSDEVWDAFRRTSVRLSINGRSFDISPADRSERGTFPSTVDGPIHILTAWNPQGLEADDDANRRANRRLRAELDATQGLTVWDATGFGGGPLGCEGTWHEEGFAVVGLDRASALRLATRFDQRAIFEWTDETGGFGLIACDGSADEPRGWRIMICEDGGEDGGDGGDVRHSTSPPKSAPPGTE